MAQIHSTIHGADGEPKANATVTIELSWDQDVSPIALDTDNDVAITGPDIEVTDEDGFWEAELVPNEVITPLHSVYKITEAVDGEDRVYYVDVPDGATPVYFIGDILVPAPAWESD